MKTVTYFVIIIQYLSFLHSATSNTEQICLKLLGEKFSEPLERLRLATAQVFASKPDHIEWWVLYEYEYLWLFDQGFSRN